MKVGPLSGVNYLSINRPDIKRSLEYEHKLCLIESHRDRLKVALIMALVNRSRRLLEPPFHQSIWNFTCSASAGQCLITVVVLLVVVLVVVVGKKFKIEA